ncbi:Lrp/AsnC family transcriptional regulator [Candidatus Geothermarchaeota archaeon]|nr:MAG: Lrp/AsnC family transcriptional regulator [Candidatus Geothermarchaeota archaeon]
MALAYILIGLEPKGDLIRRLRKISGIREAYRVYGLYDMVVKIEAEDLTRLRKIIVNKIKKARGIREDLTLVVSDLRYKVRSYLKSPYPHI